VKKRVKKLRRGASAIYQLEKFKYNVVFSFYEILFFGPSTKANHFILRYFCGQKALSLGILESNYIVAYS